MRKRILVIDDLGNTGPWIRVNDASNYKIGQRLRWKLRPDSTVDVYLDVDNSPYQVHKIEILKN